MMSTNRYGNRVVMKMLSRGSNSDFDNRPIVGEILEKAIGICTHRNGCSVAKRCIDTSEDDQRCCLLQSMVDEVSTLVSDPYGNYVVQCVSPPAVFPRHRPCARDHILVEGGCSFEKTLRRALAAAEMAKAHTRCRR